MNAILLDKTATRAEPAVALAPAQAEPHQAETTRADTRQAETRQTGRRIGARRLALSGAGLALALAAGWYGYDWSTVGRFIESTDDAYVGGDITVIAPRVAGLIARVAVTDNQRIHAGDILVQLDDRDYRAALAKAEGAVAAARAKLANLKATRLLQQALIDQASAAVDAADAEVARSAFDLVRYRRLRSDQFASAQRLQQVDAEHKQAQAGAERARAGLVAARRRIDVLDTEEQQAQAALVEARAERDLARLDLDHTVLRAPVDGTVGNRSARDGAFAAVGAQLLSIVPAAGLWVDANFKESQLAGMRPGQPATITADALPGRTFQGHVASLAPATGAMFSVLPPENATGNFTHIVQRVPVRIRLDGDAARLGRLRPGLSITAAVDLRPEQSAAVDLRPGETAR